MDAMPHDIELRLVDPSKNRFRLYGITECRSLFGELCLRIAWGRIGNRRLRERTEVFPDAEALERRRRELLILRRRHGYVPTRPIENSARKRGGERRTRTAPASMVATVRVAVHLAAARAVVEEHGLAVDDANVRALVGRWCAATREIAEYLAERRAERLEMIDVATLATMCADVIAAA